MKISTLTEGLSPVLFHFTSLSGAAKIVSQNQFRLTTTYANDSEQETGSKKLFFLSTTRSRTGGYTMSSTHRHNAGNVVLTLDGRALGQNYSGDPVEYWGRGYLNIAPEKNEMEDRVYNDKPTIPNAMRYISAIHILLTKDLLQKARASLAILKRSGLPIFLYQDKDAFILQDTRKAKSLADFDMVPVEKQERWPSYDRPATDKLMRRRNPKEQNKIQYGPARWLTLMSTPVDQFDKMGRGYREFIRGLAYGTGDALRSMSADLHNSKNDEYWNSKFFPIMKANNLRSASDIMKFIVDRWKPHMPT